MAKHKHPLPSPLIPEGDICVPLFIPDDDNYINLVIGRLRYLTLDRMYQRDENNSALIVREQFMDRTFKPFIDALENGDGCSDGTGSLGSCFRLDTTTEAFTFYPNDPFTDKANADNKILSHTKFARFADLPINDLPVIGEFIEEVLNGVSGYFDNDIFITEDVLSPFTSPLERLGDMLSQFTSFPLPYVKIELEGEGQFEIELVNVPAGGSVLLIPDLDISLQGVWNTVVDLIDNDGSLPAGWMLTEVNRDIAGLELVATQVQEFEFTTDTTHTMHAIFIPVPKPTPPFIYAFGGIREIEVCGSLRIIGTQTGEEINKANHKSQEFVREGFIMATQDDICAGMLCAMETLAQRILLAKEAGNIENDVILQALGDGSGFETKLTDSVGSIAPEYETTVYEQKSGGATRQAQEFANLFTLMDDQLTAGWADLAIQKSIEWSLEALALATFSVVDYRSDGDTTVVIDVAKLAEEIYCTGSFSKGLFNYASNPVNHDEDELSFILDMASEVSSSVKNDWYNEGKNEPNNLYQGYACYRHPAQSFTYDLANPVSRNPINWYTGSLTNRKLRVEIDVIAPFVDDVGRVYDGIYIKETNDTLDTWTRMRLRTANGGNLSMATVPDYLDGTGKYVLDYTVGASALAGTYFYQLGLDRAWGTAVSGELRITVYDLGAI